MVALKRNVEKRCDQTCSTNWMATLITSLTHAAGLGKPEQEDLHQYLFPALITLPRSPKKVINLSVVSFRALLRTLIKAADTDGNNEMDWEELENFSNFELIFTDWQEIVAATWMATEQMQSCGRVEYTLGGGRQDQEAPCLSQTNQPVSDILRSPINFQRLLLT